MAKDSEHSENCIYIIHHIYVNTLSVILYVASEGKGDYYTLEAMHFEDATIYSKIVDEVERFFDQPSDILFV